MWQWFRCIRGDHEMVLDITSDPHRQFLVCMHCGHESPGLFNYLYTLNPRTRKAVNVHEQNPRV